MMADEIQEVRDAVPFVTDEAATVDNYPGFPWGMIQWHVGSNAEAPPYWSPARDTWLREFVALNGPLLAIINTFINKAVTVPWKIAAHDRSIARHVKTATTLTKSFRRNSGSMSSSPIKGFKEAMKMFWLDYLTQDNGAFALVMGDGPADGPIVGAPYGLLHLDSALCTRTKNAEYPVKYLNRGRGGDGQWYKLHYTRVIEMANMPSADIDLNGVGRCAVSCCLEAAQELYDIYKYSAEMFGSRPPRQILYAETGATLNTLDQAVQHWNMKLDNESRSRFGGTLLAAPDRSGRELKLHLLKLSSMPENFDRADTTSINMSAIAAAFGMDLRDVAYTLGAPSRTGDAEVQDRKGRGKGVGEALETLSERFNEVAVGEQFFVVFDYLDDEQDEQAATIRGKRSEARQRDLMGGLTTVRVEREFMLASGEISQENFDDMELSDGRLPDGLDVLLLFQSQDTDYAAWLDLSASDPTNIGANDAAKMIEEIHVQQIEVSEFIHKQTQAEKRRKARQALAALEKLRLMYEQALATQIAQEQAEQAMMAAATPAEEQGERRDGAEKPTPPNQPGRSPTGKEPYTPPRQGVQPGSMVNGAQVGKELATKQLGEVDALLTDYATTFRELADRGLEREISEERFEEMLGLLVFNTLLTLYLRGARKSEAELSGAEWEAIFQEADPHWQAIRSLADDIFMGGIYAENRLAVYARIDGWLNIASGFYFFGETFRADDPKLRWVRSPLTDSCRDCVRLDLQVHRASAWRAAGYSPRHWRLACHGINCQCHWEQTDAPERGEF